MKYIEFLNNYSGALMVTITFIYVIATIAIWRANRKSAEATEKQLEESRTQFEESKRLECMPFLQIERCIPESASFETTFPLYDKESSNESFEIVKIRNLGNGTAINLIYTWECKDVNKTETECMPICAIQKGDTYYWQMNFETDSFLHNNFHGKLCFEFNDLLGNTYEQRVDITFIYEDEELFIHHFDVGNPIFEGTVLYSLANGKDIKDESSIDVEASKLGKRNEQA